MMQHSELNNIHNLPPQPTPFIGRTDEVAEITAMLTDPACRLLTLVGSGGIGKTRLAIKVATELSNQFGHGLYFIPLQSTQSVDLLISTIADALNVSLSGLEDPHFQLFNYLQDKELLLLLDNFEQLLGNGGATIVASLLETAPAVKLLVTSREVLNLQEEWLYMIQGLPYPKAPTTPFTEIEDSERLLASYGAVQLFVERARRVRHDFSLAEQQADVVRICQLVAGMPLALELAASWTKTLNSTVIAAEIQQNLDFLSTNLRNIPERHRSIQAIFDYSWQRLNDKEKTVFKRLSIFRGGFQREAAQKVAGASLPVLSVLVDKSLLRWDPDGRYQIHELLRQYAEDQLKMSLEDVARTQDAHCVYYTDFLRQQNRDIRGVSQQEAARKIAADLDNVRAAWEWAIQQGRIDEIYNATDTLHYFFQFQSRYQEGADTFERSVKKLDERKITGQALAELLVNQGWFCIRTGQYQKAKSALTRSWVIFDELKVAPRLGTTTDPLTALGTLANVMGDYTEAEKLGQESRRLHEARGDNFNLMDAYYVLTSAALAQGKYETAQKYAEQAYAQAEVVNDRWMMAYILNDMGNIARGLSEYDQARRRYEASYAIRKEFGDPEGQAAVLNHLGKVVALQDDHAEAKRLYQQALAAYRDINDKGGLATSLGGLGEACCALGETQAARQYFRQALETTTAIQFIPLMLSILTGVTELLLQTGQTERGLELLALVTHHPASEHETRVRAQRILAHIEPEFPEDKFGRILEQGINGDLDLMVITVQTQLTALVASGIPGTKNLRPELKVKETTKPSATHSQQSSVTTLPSSHSSILVEQLTPREYQVLQLIATGLTNQQIAKQLVISIGTVKSYTNQIYGKLNVRNRTQAVARARELELLA